MVLAALEGHDSAVWLFGSCARGEPRQHSDIDIAILPRDELPSSFSASRKRISRRARSPTMSISSICGKPIPLSSTKCGGKV